VAVNCGAIPENLVESELFGHERGSFTGADQKRVGKFQFADRGTIFLDELGETSLATQVKLLRVLQEREITPVGANRNIPINVRVIAATNRDLEKAIREKRFREDLFYRLKVVTIHVPPLRERPEDIEPLIAYFCEKDNAYYRRNRAFLMSAVRLLERYAWPGNVRELENSVYAFLMSCEDNRVRPDDIDSKYWARTSPQAETYYNLKQRHEEEERQLLRGVLDSADSQREAARKIELEYSTFRDRLKRLGLLNGAAPSPGNGKQRNGAGSGEVKGSNP
jgi:transcriptional regulator with PAS, ATPase and Fis domain